MFSSASRNEIKDCNVMIDGNFFFDHSLKNDSITNENIGNIATGQETVRLL